MLYEDNDQALGFTATTELLGLVAPTLGVLVLGTPGSGKSAAVQAAARSAGLTVRVASAPQLAPEDVLGAPRIDGDRTVWCPPRALLPEGDAPFCLLIKDLAGATPDVQKALTTLLLERRVGEHALPAGSWVVATGTRPEDRTWARQLSPAISSRLLTVHLQHQMDEWLPWAEANGIRADVRFFAGVTGFMNRVPGDGITFTNPRTLELFSRALDAVDGAGKLTPLHHRALAFGLLTATDAALWCSIANDPEPALTRPMEWYLRHPEEWRKFQPAKTAPIMRAIRRWVERLHATNALPRLKPGTATAFLRAFSLEQAIAMTMGLTDAWIHLGAGPALQEILEGTLDA